MFKIGDKVRCVHNVDYDGDSLSLTTGAIYEICEIHTNLDTYPYLAVVNDMECIGCYSSDKFELACPAPSEIKPSQVFISATSASMDNAIREIVASWGMEDWHTGAHTCQWKLYEGFTDRFEYCDLPGCTNKRNC